MKDEMRIYKQNVKAYILTNHGDSWVSMAAFFKRFDKAFMAGRAYQELLHEGVIEERLGRPFLI